MPKLVNSHDCDKLKVHSCQAVSGINTKKLSAMLFKHRLLKFCLQCMAKAVTAKNVALLALWLVKKDRIMRFLSQFPNHDVDGVGIILGTMCYKELCLGKVSNNKKKKICTG